MSSQEYQDRTLTFPVDTFTFRIASIPQGAPFSVTEFARFDTAYRQFLGSIRELDSTFLNGQACPVRYSFDATRPEEDRLLIDWDWLTPLFWGPPPGERNFVRLHTIVEFVEKKVRFQKCTTVTSDTCSCGKKPNEVISPRRECKNRLHWHHFCNAHVSAWLTNYLVPAILQKESKDMFTAIIAKVHQDDPDILEYYSMGERTDSQVLLDSARNISGAGSGAAESKECK